jgi:hypothetical protein
MKTVIDYLDDLNRKLGSDYKIAKAINSDTSAISMIRKRGQMSDETALKIGMLLEIEPSEVLIAAAIARSKGDVKAAWLNVSHKLGATVLILLALGGLGYQSEIKLLTSDNIHYA